MVSEALSTSLSTGEGRGGDAWSGCRGISNICFSWLGRGCLSSLCVMSFVLGFHIVSSEEFLSRRIKARAHKSENTSAHDRLFLAGDFLNKASAFEGWRKKKKKEKKMADSLKIYPGQYSKPFCHLLTCHGCVFLPPSICYILDLIGRI